MENQERNKRKIGAAYESAAVSFLTEQGYTILERNFRCRIGEIDIIAWDKHTLVFVEVKYRRNYKTGYPEEAVGYRKQKIISRCADYYMLRHGFGYNASLRFDVVSILGKRINLIRNAFPYVSR